MEPWEIFLCVFCCVAPWLIYPIYRLNRYIKKRKLMKNPLILEISGIISNKIKKKVEAIPQNISYCFYTITILYNFIGEEGRIGDKNKKSNYSTTYTFANFNMRDLQSMSEIWAMGYAIGALLKKNLKNMQGLEVEELKYDKQEYGCRNIGVGYTASCMDIKFTLKNPYYHYAPIKFDAKPPKKDWF